MWVWYSVVGFHHAFGPTYHESPLKACEDGEDTVAVSHFKGCVCRMLCNLLSHHNYVICWYVVKIKGSIVSPYKSPSYIGQSGMHFKMVTGITQRGNVCVCLSKCNVTSIDYYSLWDTITVVSFLLRNVMVAFLK